MNLQTIIGGIGALAPFPRTAMRIIDLAGDESRSTAEIADLVKTDANLAGNMLRLANSTYFGLKQKVDSIDRAVTLLGSRFLLEMALFSMTTEMFGAPQAGYALKAGELRRHAMVSAIFARELAKQYGLDKIETVFTAALIKDIGKTILNQHLVEASGEIDALIENQKVPFFEAEKAVLGIDHAELGAMALEQWDLPENLVIMVRNHHLQKDPVVAPREVCVIYLADTICSMFGFGAGKDGLHYPFSDDILLRYFDIQDLHGIMARLLVHVVKIDDLMRDF